MKNRRFFTKVTAVATAAVIALSAFGASAFAAGSTPAGYIQENVEFETAHADLIEYIYQQTMQFQPSINLENYQFHVSDFETLCLSLYGTHPDLTVILPNQNFYSCSYNPMSGIAANVMPKYAYSREEATQRLERFYEMADYFLGFVNDDMDDFTKALILHDELAIHGEYIISKQLGDGTTVLSSDYSQMVEGWGRCETYTEVYAYLLAQNGIRSEIVNSDTMNHEWLKAQLDGQYYNIDLTWDDPVYDRPGKVSHNYFLWSDEEFQTESSVKDAHTDYTSAYASGSGYDSYDNLHGFETQVCWLNGTLYAIDENAKQLVVYDHLTDGMTPLCDVSGWWSAGNGYYWNGNFSSLVAYGGLLYYNSPGAVYSYDPVTGETVKVADNEDSNELYGLRRIDNVLYGVNAPNPNVTGTLTALYELPAIEPEPEYTLGDVNIDGEIDIRDATEIQRYLANYIGFDRAQWLAADFDLDGDVTVADVTAIQRFINR